MFLYLLSALVGLTVLLAGVGIVQMTRGEDRVAQRLQRIRGVMLGPSESLEKALGGGSLPFWAYPLKFLSYALPGRSDPRLLRWGSPPPASATWTRLGSSRASAWSPPPRAASRPRSPGPGST